MPGGDRTGPMGAGPMTGRGAGYCAGFDAPGFVRRGMGGGGFGYFGFGRGGRARGAGRGWRHMFYATGLPGWARATPVAPAPDAPPDLTRDQQIDALRAQVNQATGLLEQLLQRMNDLERKADS